MADLLTVMAQHKGNFGARQCLSLDHLENVAEFGFLGAQKLASSRRVVKQVTHLKRCSARVGCGPDVYRHLTTLAERLVPPCGFSLSIGRKYESRD